MKASRRGFTLLEVLVATAIMGIAVITLLSALSVSLRNGARVIEHDRLAMLAREKMDEILADGNLPLEGRAEGKFPTSATGGPDAGFSAVFGVFDAPPQLAPGAGVLERVALHVWWKGVAGSRSLDLEGFRRNTVPQQARL